MLNGIGLITSSSDEVTKRRSTLYVRTCVLKIIYVYINLSEI